MCRMWPPDESRERESGHRGLFRREKPVGVCFLVLEKPGRNWFGRNHVLFCWEIVLFSFFFFQAYVQACTLWSFLCGKVCMLVHNHISFVVFFKLKRIMRSKADTGVAIVCYLFSNASFCTIFNLWKHATQWGEQTIISWPRLTQMERNQLEFTTPQKEEKQKKKTLVSLHWSHQLLLSKQLASHIVNFKFSSGNT